MERRNPKLPSVRGDGRMGNKPRGRGTDGAYGVLQKLTECDYAARILASAATAAGERGLLSVTDGTSRCFPFDCFCALLLG